MISLHTIFIIARYEAKILFRSWFFRIFSVLSLGIIILLNVAFFGIRHSPWMLRGIPSGIPYMNLLLLNVAQAVIGVFMASDFLKYDRKLDTTDVIYIRSMTNADYVLGKVLGVLSVFAGLNLLVIITALVFNVFFAEVPIVAAAYASYPILISLPTLIFIFGLTFLLMVIIQNQAITFIILLGYIASTVFFLSFKFHYLFDYMAFNVPLMYSDFTGFGEMSTILIHRGIYLLLGIGFISITILLMRRLPQSRFMNRLSLVIAVLSISGAVILGKIYLDRLSESKAARVQMKALNRDLSETPVVSINTSDLDLIHKDKEIDVTARLTFTNKNEQSIDSYIFSLNPGLKIINVTGNGNDIPYTRNMHIISVESPHALEPDAVDSLTIVYSGNIDEEACYMDIDEESRELNYRVSLYNIDKRYSFITDDFVLLTPETLWYPKPGIPYGGAYPELQAKDFTTYKLRVETKENLTAISQGELIREINGAFIFKPEVLMPQLTLAIGHYETLSVTVDSVDYNLHILEGHNFFSEHFTDLGEKLPELIRDTKMRYENRLGLDYKYQRLNLVETPIQFFVYQHMWTVGMETVQPEMILLPEMGIPLQSADFKRFSYYMNRRVRRGREAQTPEEIQSNLFRRFVSSTFINPSQQFRGMRGGIRVGERRLSLNPMESNSYASYSVFPLFYSHIYNISSKKWPIFNTALEFFIMGKVENQSSRFSNFFRGMSSNETSNLALMKQTLYEMLTDSDEDVNVFDVMSLKCAYLFALIQSELGSEDFGFFLQDYFEFRAFVSIGADDWVNELKNQFELDLAPYFDSWLHEKNLPAFLIGNPVCTEILDEERTRYQVVFKVTNPEEADGLISIEFRMGESRGFSMGRPVALVVEGFALPDAGEIHTIKAGQTKEIGVVIDGNPRAMRINTFISQNIPSILERWFEKKPEIDEDAEPFEDAIISDTPVTLTETGVVIVDNEDPGFAIHSPSSESYIKKKFNLNSDDKDEYIGIRFWNLPRRWRASTNSEFYGAYRLSAYYLRAGEGENKAEWKADIPQNSKYNVYYHVSKFRSSNRFLRRRRGGKEEAFIKDFNFKIHHDNGIDEVKLDNENAESGWNLLGTFYFSEGSAKVELSDLSEGRMVYADAVKWTEVE